MCGSRKAAAGSGTGKEQKVTLAKTEKGVMHRKCFLVGRFSLAYYRFRAHYVAKHKGKKKRQNLSTPFLGKRGKVGRLEEVGMQSQS